MRSVDRISRRRKPRDVKEQELTGVVPDGDALSRRLWAIQALLPVALEEFLKEMHREFEELTGPRYERTGGKEGLVRWGRQPGSIFLLDQKVPVEVPRVRDHRRGVEAKPEAEEATAIA